MDVRQPSTDQLILLYRATHTVVRDAIAPQELPKLREMLADNEIILGNVSGSDQSHTEQQTKQTDQQHK